MLLASIAGSVSNVKPTVKSNAIVETIAQKFCFPSNY